MRYLLLLICAIVTINLPAQVIITNTTVVDVENRKLLLNQDVVVQNGTITATGKKLKVPPGAQVIDGKGKWLMPGLVDAHVHFFQSGGLYTRPDVIDLRQTHPFTKEIDWVHAHMENFLRRYNRAGITTVIDVGATLNFLRQRDTFRNKSYAPTIFMTGPLLTTYEPDAFKNLKDDAPFYFMQTPAEARELVQKQVPLKPDFIKIWYIVTSRNTDSGARASLPVVQAVIEEAHKNGLRVAVHATERITATLAVQAGADYLVHSVEDEPVDAAFVQLLKSRGTVLSPTLVVGSNYGRVLGQSYTASDDDYRYAHPTPLVSAFGMKDVKDTTLVKNYKAYFTRMAGRNRSKDSLLRRNLKTLIDGGVTIATGTDAGNIGTQHVSSYFDELQAMQQSGLTQWDLLQASTINGAKAMGKATEFGAVKKGQRADLLLLTKNPVEHFRNWQSIEWVINKGVAIQPDSFLQATPVELADEQLAAYNAHNLEAFLRPYAEDIEIFDLQTGKTLSKGKEAMRKAYSFLNKAEALHCTILNRIVQGNVVIDHEEVVIAPGQKVYAVAIYEIKNGKIQKVWFTQ